jgi:orotate phosphoribosyltransferase
MNTSPKHKDFASQAARILIETKAVLFNAHTPFQYVSGNIGPVYVDCRRPLSFPEARGALMDMAADLIKAEIGLDEIDVVAGAETAGIPYAALIADRLEKPMVYVRKKPKGHGRLSQIEGHFESNDAPKTILIEDLQNFGHSKQIFVEALRGAGATLDHFFVLFDYGIRPDVVKDNANMHLTQHHLCNWFDVLKLARDEAYFDNETLDSVESYLQDAESWQAAKRAKAS